MNLSLELDTAEARLEKYLYDTYIYIYYTYVYIYTDDICISIYVCIHDIWIERVVVITQRTPHLLLLQVFYNAPYHAIP